MLDGYYYCLNCHSEITPDYNEHCTFCGCSAIAVSGDYSNEEVERAFDLLNKEQQGLVIVPPCKVGDTVFVLTSDSITGFEKSRVKRMLLKNFQDGMTIKIIIPCVCDDWGGAVREVYPEDFGKTVFLTKEEAEKALKARCGK